MANIEPTSPCPCASEETYEDCCRPIINQEMKAWTAEALMRSRYTSYVVGDTDHLWRTWHPRTRPDRVLPNANQWIGLDIKETVDGMPGDETGIVEFVAAFKSGFRAQVLHERSLFEYRGGRWMYVEAIALTE